jgi:hypothetical protein
LSNASSDRCAANVWITCWSLFPADRNGKNPDKGYGLGWLRLLEQRRLAAPVTGSNAERKAAGRPRLSAFCVCKLALPLPACTPCCNKSASAVEVAPMALASSEPPKWRGLRTPLGCDADTALRGDCSASYAHMQLPGKLAIRPGVPCVVAGYGNSQCG